VKGRCAGERGARGRLSVHTRRTLALGVGVVLTAAAAVAQTSADSTAASAADTSAASGAPPDSARTLLSTDGAVRVYAERRPGEGINGFWWEYDPKADLERLLDKDRRARPLEKLVDAFGFEVFAPESIASLRDSVTAVADSILAARIDVGVAFDPKLTTRYVERKDSFDFVNELTSPVPISSKGTVTTTITDTNSFNESTRKVRDGRTLATTFSYRLRDDLNSSVAFNRNSDQQKRDQELESRAAGTSLNARLQGTRPTRLGDLSTDVGLSANRQSYETQVTDGQSDQFSPSWRAGITHPFAAGKIALDYNGHTDVGHRKETREVPAVDENGLPLHDESGQLVMRLEETKTEDRNLGNKLDLAADRKLGEIWTFRLNGSYNRERTQYISQADSVAGRQETRTSGDESLRAHIEGKPMPGLEILANADRSQTLFKYELEQGRFNETTSRGADTEIRYDPWKGGKLTVKMDRSREDRNFRSAQAGLVDKESAGLNWKQTVTEKVELTANYDISLDSYVFDDKAANTGDRDLRTQRGVFTVRYNVSSAFNTSVNMDVRHDETVNVNAAKSRENKTDYTYLIKPSYSWRVGRASITGDFGADARYNVYDFDEDKNLLIRRFTTQHRLQQSLTKHVSVEVLGNYEFQDQGSYRRTSDEGPRGFAKATEIRRRRLDATLLYNPAPWLRARVFHRRDGEDQYSIRQGTRTPSADYRTYELTVGLTLNRQIMRSIQLDLDFDHTQKRGDRVTDVDRRFYTIRASVEYQPFKRAADSGGGS
jgi:hypothetical protein